jgi:hypothetical protein
MTRYDGDRVWYTSILSGTSGQIGALDPRSSSAVNSTLVYTTTNLTPACAALTPGDNTATTVSSGVLAASPAVYTRTLNANGWTTYQMPASAQPWGIAITRNRMWATDNGRQKLVSLPDYHVYLPLSIR